MRLRAASKLHRIRLIVAIIWGWTDTESNKDIFNRWNTSDTWAELDPNLSFSSQDRVGERKEYTWLIEVVKHFCRATGSPLVMALAMHVSWAVKLRQAARLHASGSCRTISRFSCRTIHMICISMLAYSNYIRSIIRFIERDLYRRVGCGYYWLQELFLQQRSTLRRRREQRYWDAYSINFGENWKWKTEIDGLNFGIC